MNARRSAAPLLEVKGLRMHFPITEGLMLRASWSAR